MKCAICGGIQKEEVTKLELWADEKLIVIEDVPAKVSKQIDVLLESAGEAKRKLEVPVFSLKALKATG